MPQYAYRAKRGPQEILTGTIQAETQEAAVAKIIQSGQTPLEVGLQLSKPTAVPIKTKPVRRKDKISLAALSVLIRQLCDLQEAGVPLLKSLNILSRQKQSFVIKTLLEHMEAAVKEGASLSSAMSQHPRVFGPLYVNMVKSGEASGQLAEILSRLATFAEKDLQMQNRVKSSLLYPFIILIVGILTLFILLTFVLPRLTVMFEDLGADLPWPTKMVVALSGFFSKFWWLIVMALCAGGYALRQYLLRPEGKRRLDETLLRIPLLSDFIREAELARFARTLGTLLESGVAIPTALESTAGVVTNTVLQEEMKHVALKVRSGQSLAQALKSSAAFPEVASNIVAVGEETGRLERGLGKLAQSCERKIQESSDVFVTILGPVVLVVVVGIVGFLVVSMLLPMFQMNMIIN